MFLVPLVQILHREQEALRAGAPRFHPPQSFLVLWTPAHAFPNLLAKRTDALTCAFHFVLPSPVTLFIEGEENCSKRVFQHKNVYAALIMLLAVS